MHPGLLRKRSLFSESLISFLLYLLWLASTVFLPSFSFLPFHANFSLLCFLLIEVNSLLFCLYLLCYFSHSALQEIERVSEYKQGVGGRGGRTDKARERQMNSKVTDALHQLSVLNSGWRYTATVHFIRV